MYIGQLETSTENNEPYALKSDTAANGYNPVPELRTKGTISISAAPFSNDNANGEVGQKKTITLRIIQPDFIVNSDQDISDTSVGDSICDTPIFIQAYFPNNFNAKQLNSTLKITNANVGVFDWQTNLTIHGGCTLRAAIEESNALPGLQTILLPRPKYDDPDPAFIEDHVYKLTQKKQLEITDSLRIIGDGQPTIDGGDETRIFSIHPKKKSQAQGQQLPGVDLSVVNSNDPSNPEVIDQLREDAIEAAEEINSGSYFGFDTDKFDVELNNLDMTQGKALLSNTPIIFGGAIKVSGNDIHTVIKHSVIRDSLSSNGGGISVRCVLL